MEPGRRLLLELELPGGSPVEAIGRIFIGAGVIYVVVALSGREPIYHGLVSILVYAAYVDIPRQVFAVSLMLVKETSNVEMSLAVLLRGRCRLPQSRSARPGGQRVLPRRGRAAP